MSIYPEEAYAEYSVGDTRPYLRIEFVDEDGNPRDLSAASGAIVRGQVKGTTITSIQKAMTAIDAPNGIFEAQWSGSDLDVAPEEYEFEREIDWGGAPETLPGMLKVLIHPKMADKA